jgi:hypothetical protein
MAGWTIANLYGNEPLAADQAALRRAEAHWSKSRTRPCGAPGCVGGCPALSIELPGCGGRCGSGMVLTCPRRYLHFPDARGLPQ